MNAFAEAIDTLFNDPHLGWDAVYTPGGEPTVRVFWHRPDDVIAFADTRLHTTTAIFDVRISEVATPQAGDTLVVQGETYLIQGTPKRDDGRLIWTCEAR
ncbi:MAG: hypothetical protein KIT16_16385 [Rhodospirillaceae bacterium]|nr:hypothetical protein [Rhodospirillaceae bacterium]